MSESSRRSRVITLPWPPTTNSYWRSPSAGVVLVSERGRAYRKTVGWTLLEQGTPRTPLTGRLAVSIEAKPPDRRVRDLDNLLKSLLDSLAHAQVYIDDSQIDRLTVWRGEVVERGEVIVTVQELARVPA